MTTPVEIGSLSRVEGIMALVHQLRPHALPDCSDLPYVELLELWDELSREQKRIDGLVDIVNELVADRDQEDAEAADSA